MEEFNILLVSDFLSDSETEKALLAYADFYGSVTFKHQRRIKLIIVENEANYQKVNNLIIEKKLTTACQIISPTNFEGVQLVLKKSTIMFLPTTANISKLIPVAFEHGLPILTLKSDIATSLLDHTCSQLIEYETELELQDKYCESLEMLYFDPEGRKILSRGSVAKFEKEYSWGKRKSAAASN